MKPQNVRVMLASEYPEIRSIVREMVESDKRTVIVAQAENGLNAVMMARKLRPDVAIIDSVLPHSVGVDAVPLSRIGGFDTAQTIFSEIPNVRVVLLNTPIDMLGGRTWGADSTMFFCSENRETCVPFAIGDLGGGAVASGPLVFARIEARARAVPGSTQLGRLFDAVFLVGVFGFVGGTVLVITFLFAPVGFFVILGAAAASGLGLAGKLLCRAFRRKER